MLSLLLSCSKIRCYFNIIKLRDKGSKPPSVTQTHSGTPIGPGIRLNCVWIVVPLLQLIWDTSVLSIPPSYLVSSWATEGKCISTLLFVWYNWHFSLLYLILYYMWVNILHFNCHLDQPASQTKDYLYFTLKTNSNFAVCRVWVLSLSTVGMRHLSVCFLLHN